MKKFYLFSPQNQDEMEFIKIECRRKVASIEWKNDNVGEMKLAENVANAHLYRVFQFPATWVWQVDTNFSQVRRCHRDRSTPEGGSLSCDRDFRVVPLFIFVLFIASHALSNTRARARRERHSDRIRISSTGFTLSPVSRVPHVHICTTFSGISPFVAPNKTQS